MFATRPRRFFCGAATAVVVLLSVSACDSGTVDGDGRGASARALSLVERWGDVLVDDPAAPPAAPARSEVRFDGSAGDLAAWSAIQGIEGLRVEDGKLVGRSTSKAPVIALDFADPQGVEDELWSVEMRLRASAGTRLAAHPVLEPGPPMPAVLARVESWPIASAMTSTAVEAQNFSVVLDRVFLLEMRPAQNNIRRLLVRPTNVEGADFAIESVRLVFRRERLATIESGPGWHGLGEVFRETLVSRAPETLRFPVRLPDRPWLDLSVGTVDAESPRFAVDVASADGVETLADLEADEVDRWTSLRLDLGAWAGQDVEIRLRTAGDAGQLGMWGAPTVRSTAAQAEEPTTVVLFLADTLRADHLEAWGYGRETAPALTQLVADGVRFRSTVAQSTWTKVSVSSILTSLYPSTTGVVDLHDRISAGETTLAEVFRDAGFATFATSSVPFSGQLTNLHQGVEVMHETGALATRSEDSFRSKTARPWVDAYLEWLELHRDGPTFALIHAMDPHSPFRPEAPFDSMWASAEDAERFAAQADRVRPKIVSPLLRRFMAPSRDELAAAGVDEQSFVDHEKAWYDGSIRGLDAQIDRLMTRLGELGVRDQTLFAFVSDHGEEFLEHGEHWHGKTVYGEVANVPMALWGSGVPSGLVVDDLVQTIDLMPTLLDLAGLDIPERGQGRSLKPLLNGAELRPRPAVTELPVRDDPDAQASYAFTDGRWKLVWYPDDDATELYDRIADPLDQNDLASAQPDDTARLAAELKKFLAWAANQRLDDATLAAEMSAEELEQLRSLGYIE
ncbi:MAG: sulfatase [Acidobacteriota bacterium]